MSKIDPQVLQRVVLAIVSEHVGIHNRIMRTDLVAKAAAKVGYELQTQGQRDYFDRKVRKAIEDLRITHYVGAGICSEQDHDGGYYIAANDEEFDAHAAVEEARATTIFQSVATRRRLRSMQSPSQMRLGLQAEQKELVYP